MHHNHGSSNLPNSPKQENEKELNKIELMHSAKKERMPYNDLMAKRAHVFLSKP